MSLNKGRPPTHPDWSTARTTVRVPISLIPYSFLSLSQRSVAWASVPSVNHSTGTLRSVVLYFHMSLIFWAMGCSFSGLFCCCSFCWWWRAAAAAAASAAWWATTAPFTHFSYIMLCGNADADLSKHYRQGRVEWNASASPSVHPRKMPLPAATATTRQLPTSQQANQIRWHCTRSMTSIRSALRGSPCCKSIRSLQQQQQDFLP